MVSPLAHEPPPRPGRSPSLSRRFLGLFEGLSLQVSESSLRRWLDGGIDPGEALEVLRRIARLGPGAQEAAASVVARLAGSDIERRRILSEIEAWSREHDLGPLTHFVSALRERASLPGPEDPSESDDDLESEP